MSGSLWLPPCLIVFLSLLVSPSLSVFCFIDEGSRDFRGSPVISALVPLHTNTHTRIAGLLSQVFSLWTRLELLWTWRQIIIRHTHMRNIQSDTGMHAHRQMCTTHRPEHRKSVVEQMCLSALFCLLMFVIDVKLFHKKSKRHLVVSLSKVTEVSCRRLCHTELVFFSLCLPAERCSTTTEVRQIWARPTRPCRLSLGISSTWAALAKRSGGPPVTSAPRPPTPPKSGSSPAAGGKSPRGLQLVDCTDLYTTHSSHCNCKILGLHLPPAFTW